MYSAIHARDCHLVYFLLLLIDSSAMNCDQFAATAKSPIDHVGRKTVKKHQFVFAMGDKASPHAPRLRMFSPAAKGARSSHITLRQNSGCAGSTEIAFTNNVSPLFPNPPISIAQLLQPESASPLFQAPSPWPSKGDPRYPGEYSDDSQSSGLTRGTTSTLLHLTSWPAVELHRRVSAVHAKNTRSFHDLPCPA